MATGTVANPADPVDGLSDFIATSPTPWHAARNGGDILVAAGFVEVGTSGDWLGAATRGFVVRDGSLVAWSGAPGAVAGPIRMIGAHTDSPGLRVRPRPDLSGAGTRQLGVETYGGTLLNTWLDLDLTVAGRVVVADRNSPDGLSSRLFHHPDALLRVTQLAIHLDRNVNEGLVLDRQRHVNPIWGLGDPRPTGFRDFLAQNVGVRPEEVLSWDAQLAGIEPPRRIGADLEMFAAPRLDDLCCCYGALRALAAQPTDGPPSVVVLNDHEEVGSTSATGAVGAWLAEVLERVAVANGGSRSDLIASLPLSNLASADMAHATHPNYEDRHEPSHPIHMGGGPVIKYNVNARYATDSNTAAAFKSACETAGVAFQEYSHRGDLPCGSTIGPISAAALAIDTVDVGMAQLSMHSARELMACSDVQAMCGAFGTWLNP